MPSDQQPARWLADFHVALVARDEARLQALFADECYWREFLAFTWNIVALEGRERIWNMLFERLSEVKPEKWQIEQVDEPGDTIGAWFSFETAVGRGKGHLRLKDGRCWTFFTTLRADGRDAGLRLWRGLRLCVSGTNLDLSQRRDCTDKAPFLIPIQLTTWSIIRLNK